MALNAAQKKKSLLLVKVSVECNPQRVAGVTKVASRLATAVKTLATPVASAKWWSPQVTVAKVYVAEMLPVDAHAPRVV